MVGCILVDGAQLADLRVSRKDAARLQSICIVVGQVELQFNFTHAQSAFPLNAGGARPVLSHRSSALRRGKYDRRQDRIDSRPVRGSAAVLGGRPKPIMIAIARRARRMRCEHRTARR
ncbi:MAG: hypothetical protein U9R64_15685 [Pseudomonadota bacterium]|nr:hypothetical protein [Pseudomonadota bacterium]